jgi:hypothetical protein
MKFPELDEAAKAYAVEKYNYTNDRWWSDGVIEMAKDDGRELGFNIDKVYFSGFWSQGDGASWVGHIDVVKWCTNQMEADPQYYMWAALADHGDYMNSKVGITQSGQYTHRYTMVCDANDLYPDDTAVYSNPDYPIFIGQNVNDMIASVGGDNGLDDLLRDMLDSARDYAVKIYADLEKEYEYLSSEEAFAETAESNEWSFDETGEME